MGGPAVGISTVQVQSNCRHAVICDIICLAAQELGYDSGTPEQRLVIESFVKGQDVFVSLPIGSGKSLCMLLAFASNL